MIDITKKFNKKLHPEFVKGAYFATSLIEEIGKNDTNEFLLGDRILCKLNILDKKYLRLKSKK